MQPIKATVQYKPSKYDVINVGSRAMVYPVDHISPFVSNEAVCYTSKVISVNYATGVFETMNSIYKPVKLNTH